MKFYPILCLPILLWGGCTITEEHGKPWDHQYPADCPDGTGPGIPGTSGSGSATGGNGSATGGGPAAGGDSSTGGYSTTGGSSGNTGGSGTYVPPPPPPPPPPPTCTDLDDEAACTDRADCTPIYAGTDCTCGPECTCIGGEPGCICANFGFLVCIDAEQ